jgi:hypothetical protein
VFVTGLLAGCVTFGGAFTAVPCAPARRCALRLARTLTAACVRLFCRYVFRSLVTLSQLMTPQQARTRRHQRTQCTILCLRVLKRLRARQFLDGIAVVNFVPTPLVMFVTW